MSNGNFYNLDAEKSILAAMMKKGIAEKYINQLTPEEFYQEEHRKLFIAMQALYILKKPIDLPLMDEMLTRQNGNADLMNELFSIIQTNSFNAEFALGEHIRIVKDCAERRELYNVLDKARNGLKNPAYEYAAILADTRARLRGLTKSKGHIESLQTVLLNAFTDLEERAAGYRKGMPSGVEVLDKHTAGFHKGEMTIIGARPAVGKSALACQIAIGAAQNGHKVCVLSREMTDIQYGVRILSRGTQVSNIRMRTGELTDKDWEQLSESTVIYGNHDIKFLFDIKFIEDLQAEAQALKESEGLDMLIVDYIQLLQSKQRFEKDYQRIGYISKALKDMSTELNIAVIALAQVGRSSDGSMPTLSELRGSGDLEQDADNVIFLHHPESPSDKWLREKDKEIFDALEAMKYQLLIMNVAKQRQGETGALTCIFNPASMTFTSRKDDTNVQASENSQHNQRPAR